MAQPLKAPFPYFGGKRTIASAVWKRLGDVQNYIEPFFGSGAMLLLRPGPPTVETVNDLDSYLANFWRAVQTDPAGVADHANWPVNEADLHARHRWLVLSDDAQAFRQRMRTDPDYFDAKVAGWWCWGLCCWIGSGWCAAGAEWNQTPKEASGWTGVHAEGPTAKRPLIAGDNPASYGKGVHAKGDLSQQLPDPGSGGLGVHPAGPRQGNRPQLADAYDIGRGVNANGDLGACEARREWLTDWFSRLRDRLRLVRVCCGDWSRVCSSESTTTRLGTTGVFLDPPYGKQADRCNTLYAHESGTVADDVRKWCLEKGAHPLMRIALCGYEGEGHEELEAQGWKVLAWKAQGGYGNRSGKGKENARRERIWFSPHCCFERGLFDLPDEAEIVVPVEEEA